MYITQIRLRTRSAYTVHLEEHLLSGPFHPHTLSTGDVEILRAIDVFVLNSRDRPFFGRISLPVPLLPGFSACCTSISTAPRHHCGRWCRLVSGTISDGDDMWELLKASVTSGTLTRTRGRESVVLVNCTGYFPPMIQVCLWPSGSRESLLLRSRPLGANCPSSW